MLEKVAFCGNHVVKHACNLLQTMELSSADNDIYAISVAGSKTGLGLQSLRDLSVNISVRIASDSFAVRRFTSTRGFEGKMKHNDTKYLWTQERLAIGHIEVDIVASIGNRRYLLT